MPTPDLNNLEKLGGRQLHRKNVDKDGFAPQGLAPHRLSSALLASGAQVSPSDERTWNSVVNPGVRANNLVESAIMVLLGIKAMRSGLYESSDRQEIGG